MTFATRSATQKQALRRTKGVPHLHDTEIRRGFEIYLKAWAVCVQQDRLGRLPVYGPAPQAMKALHNAFRAFNRKSAWWPFIQAVVKEYRKRRRMASSPLRVKADDRLSTIPVCGPLASLQSLGGPGMVHGRIRKALGGYTLCYTVWKRKQYFKAKTLYSRCPRKGQIRDVGMAATPEGLKVVQRRHNGQMGECLIPKDLFSLKGAPQEILSTVFSDKVRTASLDTSLWASLSGEMKEATSRLHRWFRSRQAVGAIAYRKFESLGDSNRKANETYRNAGLPLKLLRKIGSTTCEACPTCSAPVLLRVNPMSGLVSLRLRERSHCECGERHDLGKILAAAALDRGVTKHRFSYARVR